MDTELDFEKHYRLVREVIETIVLTVLMFFIIRLAVQNFNIEGHSMEPSLHDTELILVDKWSYHFHPPSRGDVIVFVAPPQPDQDFIKRIVAVPGDVVTVQGTTVIVNGKTLTEPYVKPQYQGNTEPSFTNRVIPQGLYFVMGDNRGGSYDSRAWGCLPQQNIIGRAALVYWPFGQDNNGLLPNYASAFDHVPAPPKIKNPTDICRVTKPINGAASAGHTQSVSSMPLTPVSGSGLDLNLALLLAMPGMFVLASRRRK